MLILELKKGGVIEIEHGGQCLEVHLQRVKSGDCVRLGFSGPRAFAIDRDKGSDVPPESKGGDCDDDG